ncbi:hypothetical protein ACVW00_003887 [Marmoricola sp. URHA0025 HA25]
MMRRTSAAALGLLLLPALLVSGKATAATMDPTPAARTAATSVCASPARKPFVPLRANAVGRNIAVYPVDIGGEPPLTTAGKAAFGWDRTGPKPGSAYGNVRFTAHTYPDGSALGNRLLKRLRVGGRIILRGSTSTLCYRVTRMKVTTPTHLGGYYSTIGSPKLAIVVCSGKRLGPGNWVNRTIWIAKPSTS